MTTNYYHQEAQTETLDDQILTLESALVQADPATAQTLLDEAQVWLGSLYDDAEQRSDGNAMLAVSESWAKIQTLKAQVDTAAATAHSAIAGMKTVVTQRDDALSELAELTEAVEHHDNMHPLVDALIEEVEQNTLEWAGESGYEDAQEEAYDDQRQDFISTIRRTLGLDQEPAAALIDTLFGWKHTVGIAEVDLLIEFLQTYRASLES